MLLRKTKNIDTEQFDKYYQLMLEAIEYKQNKKILENVNQCIRINPDLSELYQIKIAVLLEMNMFEYNKAKLKSLNSKKIKKMSDKDWDYYRIGAEPYKTLLELIQLSPHDPQIDELSKIADVQWYYGSLKNAYEKLEKMERQMAAFNVVITSLNAAITSFATLQSKNTGGYTGGYTSRHAYRFRATASK